MINMQTISKKMVALGKTLFLGAFLLMTASQGYAEWNPSELVATGKINGKHQEALEEPKFKELQEKLIEHLTNSWCSPEKTRLIMDLIFLERPKQCVEVGVFTGSSLLPIAMTLKYLKQGKVAAIDAWSNGEAIRGLDENGEHREWWSKIDMKATYVSFLLMLQHWAITPYCSVIPKTSEEAARQIKTIDFLHLDGNFTAEIALKDVLLYVPKVKEGGYILFSNLFYNVNGDHPKRAAFAAALDYCEIVCDIDQNNTVLLKKIKSNEE